MQDTTFSLPRHPLDIKPAGNVYTATTKPGIPFWQLPDELLLQILEHLDPRSLLHLGATCKALFAFSRLDELWKTFCTILPPGNFQWQGTWYTSYASLDRAHLARVSCKDVCSDILYRPFLCAHTPLEPYTTNIPPRNRILRLPDLSAAEFSTKWTNKPFILTEPVREWPVFKAWSPELLLEKYSDTVFRAEAVDWPLHTYMDYMRDNGDESPLYLFDRAFVEKMGISVGREAKGEYWAPDCFGKDLFSTLGEHRPDSRWLIIGPERSGSTFHKDPNATSAWNAVLRGSKYWIMFPTGPSCPPPPGVFVSEDQSEVTSPFSIAEWFLGFHAEARLTPGCLEGICHAGEVLHVPSGWWHLVVNLSPSIAITQNFVPQAHLASALSFLKGKPDQISGFQKTVTDAYGLFVEKLQERHPAILAKALEEIEGIRKGKKRKWNDIVNGHDRIPEESRKTTGFSFGFGEDACSDDEIP